MVLNWIYQASHAYLPDGNHRDTQMLFHDSYLLYLELVSNCMVLLFLLFYSPIAIIKSGKIKVYQWHCLRSLMEDKVWLKDKWMLKNLHLHIMDFKSVIILKKLFWLRNLFLPVITKTFISDFNLLRKPTTCSLRLRNRYHSSYHYDVAEKALNLELAVTEMNIVLAFMYHP